MEEEKKKAGAPTKYKEEFNELAYKLCLLGHTDQELADFFEVVEDTINEWKKVYPQFSVSIAKGKTIADAEVAHSLHKRAVGYKYDEVTYEKLAEKLDGIEEDGDMKLEVFKKKVVTKELPPDSGAALKWLSNRQGKKWRDKTEVSGTIKNVNYNVEMTKDEIKDISDALEKDV